MTLVSVFFTRPIAAVLLVGAAVALIVAVLPAIRQKREEVFADEEEV